MASFLLPIRVSIAAPAFNESAGIRAVVEEWIRFLKQQSFISQFEIVICNDGSHDATGKILDEIAKVHPELYVIHFQKNQGASAALISAIKATSFEWVVLIDADGQFLIENIVPMFDALQAENAQAVLGVRQKKDNVYARLGTKLSGVVCNVVHGSKIKDFNSAFKIVSGPLLRSLSLEAKGLNYSTEITSRLLESRAALIEVPVTHQQRSLGKSSMRLLRDSAHRFLFVFYIALRQLLLKLEILRRFPDEK